MQLLLQLAELEAPELQELPCEPDPWAGAGGGMGSRGGRWGEEWLEGRRQLAAVHKAVQEAGIKTFPLTAGDTMGTTAFYRGLSRPGPVISVFISMLSVELFNR